MHVKLIKSYSEYYHVISVLATNKLDYDIVILDDISHFITETEELKLSLLLTLIRLITPRVSKLIEY